jgi:hypothetical protein
MAERVKQQWFARRPWRTHPVQFWAGVVGTSLPIAKGCLTLVERAGDVDFLISFYDRFSAPVGAFLAAHWDLVVPIVGLVLLWRSLRQPKPPEQEESKPEPVAESNPEPPPPPEPLAVPETAERLIDLFKRWDETLAFAAFVLEREVCAHGSSEKDQLLCYAIRAFPMEISKGKLIELRRKFEYFRPREATQSAFTTLRSEMGDTLRECNFLLVNWINKGGAVIRGEQLLSVPVYSGFCESYKEALEAAKLLRFHTELGGLARALQELETKPTPATDPPPSKAS